MAPRSSLGTVSFEIRAGHFGFEPRDVATMMTQRRAAMIQKFIYIGVDLLRVAVDFTPVKTGFTRRSGYVTVQGDLVATSGITDIRTPAAYLAAYQGRMRGADSGTAIPVANIRITGAAPSAQTIRGDIVAYVGFLSHYSAWLHNGQYKLGKLSRQAGPHVGPGFITRALDKKKSQYQAYLLR